MRVCTPGTFLCSVNQTASSAGSGGPHNEPGNQVCDTASSSGCVNFFETVGMYVVVARCSSLHNQLRCKDVVMCVLMDGRTDVGENSTHCYIMWICRCLVYMSVCLSPCPPPRYKVAGSSACAAATCFYQCQTQEAACVNDYYCRGCLSNWEYDLLRPCANNLQVGVRTYTCTHRGGGIAERVRKLYVCLCVHACGAGVCVCVRVRVRVFAGWCDDSLCACES